MTPKVTKRTHDEIVQEPVVKTVTTVTLEIDAETAQDLGDLLGMTSSVSHGSRRLGELFGALYDQGFDSNRYSTVSRRASRFHDYFFNARDGGEAWAQ